MECKEVILVILLMVIVILVYSIMFDIYTINKAHI
jgi:hypothetical protein